MRYKKTPPLTILQVSALDRAGGAEQIAWNVFDQLRQRGVRSWMAVGKKRSNDVGVYVINGSLDPGWWTWCCHSLARVLNPLAGRVRGVLRLQALLHQIAKGSDYVSSLRGLEDFHFPKSWNLLDRAPERPSVVHLHNLHGGYFDPRSLVQLSAKVPVMLTLHDAWLLSGNCAHSLGCERWKIGCGQCPDISIYPGLKIDTTRQNWDRKKSIFQKSHLYVATPCKWLLDKVFDSILAPSVIEGRVIPNGVDVNIFRAQDQEWVRTELGLPLNESILLFVANGIKANPFKDYQTLRSAIGILGEKSSQPMHLIALGEEAKDEQIGQVSVHYVPRTTDMQLIAKYYQASDIYLHAAKADTFPNAILEAMACQLPVIASNVGGISEQVIDGVTGFLVPPENPYAIVEKVQFLLLDVALRKKMGIAAHKLVHEKFTLNMMINSYMEWYGQIVHATSLRSG